MRSRTCAEHCIHLLFTSIFALLVYGCDSETHCPSGIFEARNEFSWWLLTSLVSRSQEWAFFHVTYDIKRLLFRLVWKVVRCLSTKQDGGTTWPIFDGCCTPDRTARLHGTGRLRSVTGSAGRRLSREAQLKFPTRRRMTGRLGGWRVSRGARLGSEWRARDRGRPSRRCWPSTWWWRPSRRCWPSTWWWRPGRCGRLSTPSGLGNGRPSWDTCSGRGPSTPAKHSSDGSSKRAIAATSSGSKAMEVEQSAARPSRSRQPKKSVASSASVVGRPSSDGSERHRSRSGDRRQGVTSQLSRVPQQGTLQLQDRIHPCYLMSAVCSARQWPKPATRIAEAATSSKTSKATDDRLSRFHVKKSSKTYSSRSPLFTQSWAWSQRSPSWIWETSRPRARHSAARLGEESENSYLVYV